MGRSEKWWKLWNGVGGTWLVVRQTGVKTSRVMIREFKTKLSDNNPTETHCHEVVAGTRGVAR